MDPDQTVPDLGLQTLQYEPRSDCSLSGSTDYSMDPDQTVPDLGLQTLQYVPR